MRAAIWYSKSPGRIVLMASKCASMDRSMAFCISASSPGDFTWRIASSCGAMSFSVGVRNSGANRSDGLGEVRISLFVFGRHQRVESFVSFRELR